MVSVQDAQILSVLIDADERMTAYAIHRETGIHQPQVAARLRKLVAGNVVIAHDDERGRTYHIHPALTDPKCMRDIIVQVNKMVKIIDAQMETSVEGMADIVGFLMGRVEISQKRKR